MVLNVPVANLRAEPHTIAIPDTHDPLQETQLLYGEEVKVIKVKDGWSQVEVMEQDEYTHRNKWQGYPGWLPSEQLTSMEGIWPRNIIVTAKWATVWENSHRTRPSGLRLPLGTHLRASAMARQLWRVELVDGNFGWLAFQDANSLAAIAALPTEIKRHLIIKTAEEFIGDPYFWGGRSPYDGNQGESATGVDCSGLISLVYRSAGINIPRDAHEQFMRSEAIETLKPADLIFLTEPSDPKRIVHVMLYVGDGNVIEGPGSGQTVRKIALSERFGRSFDELTSGTIFGEQTVLFGSFFKESTKRP